MRASKTVKMQNQISQLHDMFSQKSPVFRHYVTGQYDAAMALQQVLADDIYETSLISMRLQSAIDHRSPGWDLMHSRSMWKALNLIRYTC